MHDRFLVPEASNRSRRDEMEWVEFLLPPPRPPTSLPHGMSPLFSTDPFPPPLRVCRRRELHASMLACALPEAVRGLPLAQTEDSEMSKAKSLRLGVSPLLSALSTLSKGCPDFPCLRQRSCGPARCGCASCSVLLAKPFDVVSGDRTLIL